MSKTLLRKDAIDVRVKLLGILAPRALDGSAKNLVASARELEAYVYEGVSDGGSDASVQADEGPETPPAGTVEAQGTSAPPQKAGPAKSDEPAA